MRHKYSVDMKKHIENRRRLVGQARATFLVRLDKAEALADKLLKRNRELAQELKAERRLGAERGTTVDKLREQSAGWCAVAENTTRNLEECVRQRDDLRGEKAKVRAECDAWREGYANLARQLLEQGVKFSVIMPERMRPSSTDRYSAYAVKTQEKKS